MNSRLVVLFISMFAAQHLRESGTNVLTCGACLPAVMAGAATETATHAGGVEVLVGHSEVVMCDFAACLLAELERWMLNASPAMIDLNSFADTSDYFTAPTSALEEVSKRLYTDEVRFLVKVYCNRKCIRQHIWAAWYITLK